MYWGAELVRLRPKRATTRVGLRLPHMTFYLPHGQTTGGYETWTLVQNPNPGADHKSDNLLTPSERGNVTFTDGIPRVAQQTYNRGR